jgi:hypothetical protein
MASHAPLVTAVQLQLAPAVTVTAPVAVAELARFVEVGEMVKLHGTAACVIVNVWPAIVSVAVREEVPVFAATL